MPESKKKEEKVLTAEEAETRVPTEDRPVNPDANDGGHQHTEGHGWTDEQLAEKEESASK